MLHAHEEMQSLYENWSKLKERLSKISKLERKAEEAYEEAENKLLKCRAKQFVGKCFKSPSYKGVFYVLGIGGWNLWSIHVTPYIDDPKYIKEGNAPYINTSYYTISSEELNKFVEIDEEEFMEFVTKQFTEYFHKYRDLYMADQSKKQQK